MRPSLPDPLQQAMGLFQQGQPAAALPWFDQALALRPADPFALHFKGYALCQLGRFEEGVPLLERGLQAQPRNADFHANVGMIRYVMGDVAGAIAKLESTIRMAPSMPQPYSNLSMALRDAGEFDRALVAARRAVQLAPGFPAARLNLAMALLSVARWDEAWQAYRWRPEPGVNLRDLGVAQDVAHASRLPEPLAGRMLTLHGEQGLGDALFFMRWAAALRGRGARLRFWGDERVGRILVRNGVAQEAVTGALPPPGVHAAELLWIGDLPGMLAGETQFPESIRLVALPERVASMRERLARLGGPPHIAVTWRAGLPRAGKAVLSKEVPPEAFGEALRAVKGTLVSVQRNPDPAEAAAFAAGLGHPVHDLSSANGDLDDMLAILDAVQAYVGVSNTNVHLRAALGKIAHVLVPWPAEWRWMQEGESSPWFPGFPLYRAGADGRWDTALARLAADLG